MGRGADAYATSTFGRDGEVFVLPEWRLFSVGIAVVAIGLALKLSAAPSGVSLFETPYTPDSSATFTAEDFATESSADSFDERFGSAVGAPRRRQTGETEERYIFFPSPNLGGRTVDRRSAGQPVPEPRPSAATPPAGIPKKQLRIAEASEDTNSSPDADDHTAIYDIVAHTVYLPNGRRLEAHSGLGGHIDDPRYVSEKDRGPTPPNIYDLSLRESLFHGVRAIRLNPVGGGNMFGRDGMLAHSYMLGPNGQSNGCVSFNDYPAFLNAFLNGEVSRLVVVEHLSTKPSPKTASGWLPEAIKALFGRS